MMIGGKTPLLDQYIGGSKKSGPWDVAKIPDYFKQKVLSLGSYGCDVMR